MPARLRAIVPKSQITTEGMQQRINGWLLGIAEDFKKEMQVYPPKLNKGGYQRTFRYRRGWRDAIPRISNNSAIVENFVPYARLVGGPRRGPHHQRPDMAARGWRSTTDVVPAIVARHKPILQEIILPYRTGVILPKGKGPRPRR